MVECEEKVPLYKQDMQLRMGKVPQSKKSVLRFYDVTEGEIKLFNKGVSTVTENYLRDNIAIVPQKAELFRGTIRDNIKMGKTDATEKEVLLALKLSQAEEFVMKKDEGLDYYIEQYGKNLSGGQKQRLTIARALIKNAPVIILDDCASALDLATDAKLRKSIKELPDNPTVFIVSQRVSAVMNADKILVLDDVSTNFEFPTLAFHFTDVSPLAVLCIRRLWNLYAEQQVSNLTTE